MRVLLTFLLLAAASGPARAQDARFWRRGWELGLSLGAAGESGGNTLAISTTGGALATDIRGTGFAFATRFAYRPIPWVAPYFDTWVGLPSRGRYFVGGFGIAAYPIHAGRIDPRVDLGAMYAQWHSSEVKLAGDLLPSHSATIHGVAFHLGAAAPVFVLPWLAVGPSFRYERTFWQSACFDPLDCLEINKIEIDSPGFRDAMPNLWSFGIDAVFHPSQPVTR